MTIFEQLQSALADRYRLEREIGSGGMAHVFLARDLRHDREVAVKVLKPELGAVLGAERFLSEIKVTANLQHPNLLPLFDSGEAAGLLFYVMPFVKGETLRAWLDREKQLPVEEAVRVTVALASALGYAHQHGVIHRDLKPENILIQSGEPVIADFGIALAVSNAGGARVTQTGLSLGTPQYMSPEQAAGDRVIDARTDIYSLGAVTYEMLGGEPPHSGTSAQAIIAKLMTTEPRPLHTLRSTVPIHVAAAVEKSLAKLPADRFASAREFSAAITNPSFASSRTVGYSAQLASSNIHASRWKHAGIAAAGISVLLLGLTGWLLTRPRAMPPVLRYTISLDSTQALRGATPRRIALSRDGTVLTFVGSPAQRLFVRKRDEFTASALSGIEGALAPFFSPDGKKIAYTNDIFELKVIPTEGGEPVSVVDSIVGRGQGSWGDDGFIYIGPRVPGELYRIRATGGMAPEKISVLDTSANESSHGSPAILPGSKAFLFSIGYSRGAKPRSIAVAELGSGKHRVILDGFSPQYASPGYIVYFNSIGKLTAAPFDADKLVVTGDPQPLVNAATIPSRTADVALSDSGTLMYVGGADQYRRRLEWVTRDGKGELLDSTWNHAIAAFALSPDGKMLSASVSERSGLNVWVKELDHGEARKLSYEHRVAHYPAWTADGKSISYYTESWGLQLRPADGSRPPTTIFSGRAAESEWSPDGKWLIVRTGVSFKGKGDLLAVRLGTNDPPIPLVATNFTEQQPAISRDGRWLAYSSNETGRYEVYVVPFPNASSARWPISSRGGGEPLWAHNGHELFYREPSGNIVAVDFRAGAAFTPGVSKVLFNARDYNSGTAHRGFDISQDDRRFLMLREAVSSPADREIFVVENWFHELKRKARK